MSLKIPANAIHIFPHKYKFDQMNSVLQLQLGDIFFVNEDLSVGPLLASSDYDEWIKIRSAYRKKLFDKEFDQEEFLLWQVYRKVEKFRQYDNIVVWSGCDYREQLIIGHVLQILVDLGVESLTVHHISINMKIYNGLICDSIYMVDSTKMTEKVQVVCLEPEFEAQLKLLWNALASDNPSQINSLLKSKSNIDGIMKWHLQAIPRRFPNLRSGLNFFDNEILRYTQEKGPRANLVIGYCMGGCMDRYDCVGDWYLFYRMKRMASLSLNVPLLRFEDDRDDMRKVQVFITDMGKKVFHEEANFYELNKLTDQVGGITLSSNNMWYYDGTSIVKGKAC